MRYEPQRLATRYHITSRDIVGPRRSP
jgi:hypothetical protein